MLQLWAPTADQVPPAQLSHADAPVPELLPASHSVQELAELLLYVPAEHSGQLAEPAAEYVPPAHESQYDALASELLPASQS